MTPITHVRKAILPLALLLSIASAFAARPQTETGTELTPRQRGALAAAFVNKWGMHVQRVYDVPVGVWARRMVPGFVAADPANFRAALTRDTFEGAVAQLTGGGHRLGDGQALDRLARASRQSASAAGIAEKVLGSTTADLVFTPITPCRIVDTRNTVAGPIAANTTRNFLAVTSTYTSQGGISGTCGPISSVTAVVMSVTAVTPAAAGYATLYAFGTAQPLAASLNYGAGAIVNNTVITRIPNPLVSSDFTIYSFAQSDYVVDVVGYFTPPVATPLECVTQETDISVINGDAGIASVACPTGYIVTGGGVEPPAGVSANAMTLRYTTYQAPNSWASAITNSTGASRVFTFHARCCRVPGR